MILGHSGIWFSTSCTTHPLIFILRVHQRQPGSVSCVAPKARRQGYAAVAATARGCFTTMWLCSCHFRQLPGIWALISGCPSRKESWSASLPSLCAPQKCKRLHKNSSEATARQRGGRWAGCFVLPFGMVGPASRTGISPEREHSQHPEPSLGSKPAELRTAFLLLQRYTIHFAGADYKHFQQAYLL